MPEIRYWRTLKIKLRAPTKIVRQWETTEGMILCAVCFCNFSWITNKLSHIKAVCYYSFMVYFLCLYLSSRFQMLVFIFHSSHLYTYRHTYKWTCVHIFWQALSRPSFCLLFCMFCYCMLVCMCVYPIMKI